MAQNIHQRLHACMGEVDYIQKERKQGMRYTIVSHDAVTAKVRPILVKHGIVYYPVALSRSQSGNRTEMDLTVRFANIDEPTDFIDVVATGYGVDDQDKGPGKAISYAVKYCLLKALGLETGDDPDETQDEKANHKAAANGHTNGTNGNAAPKTRDDAFFKRASYELKPIDFGNWSQWAAAFRGAAADCKTHAEWIKLEDDNLSHRNSYTSKASPEVCESLRKFVLEIDGRLNPALKP